MFRLIAAAGLAGLLSTGALAAANVQKVPAVRPAEPRPFEAVSLRIDSDDCAFNPRSIAIAAEGGSIRVYHTSNQCLIPGKPRAYDVGLGRLPAGDYTVELYEGLLAGAKPLFITRFTVGEVTTAVLRTLPLTDYTGMWWTPNEPGSALNIQHSRKESDLVAVWNTFGGDWPVTADISPKPSAWYLIGGGKWESSTVYKGTLYSVAGPLPVWPYDPRQLNVKAVGSATLDFTLDSFDSEAARLTVVQNGQTISKLIQRFRSTN